MCLNISKHAYYITKHQNINNYNKSWDSMNFSFSFFDIRLRPSWLGTCPPKGEGEGGCQFENILAFKYYVFEGIISFWWYLMIIAYRNQFTTASTEFVALFVAINRTSLSLRELFFCYSSPSNLLNIIFAARQQKYKQHGRCTPEVFVKLILFFFDRKKVNSLNAQILNT